jgi:hypothetical protein
MCIQVIHFVVSKLEEKWSDCGLRKRERRTLASQVQSFLILARRRPREKRSDRTLVRPDRHVRSRVERQRLRSDRTRRGHVRSAVTYDDDSAWASVCEDRTSGALSRWRSDASDQFFSATKPLWKRTDVVWSWVRSFDQRVRSLLNCSRNRDLTVGDGRV